MMEFVVMNNAGSSQDHQILWQPAMWHVGTTGDIAIVGYTVRVAVDLTFVRDAISVAVRRTDGASQCRENCRARVSRDVAQVGLDAGGGVDRKEPAP